MKKGTNNKYSRIKYVKDKAVMCKEAASMINKPYMFKIENMLDDRTFELFTNLKKEYKNQYLILLIMFLEKEDVKNDYEALVWSSEFLDTLNSHHEEFEELLNKI